MWVWLQGAPEPGLNETYDDEDEEEEEGGGEVDDDDEDEGLEEEEEEDQVREYLLKLFGKVWLCCDCRTSHDLVETKRSCG